MPLTPWQTQIAVGPLPLENFLDPSMKILRLQIYDTLNVNNSKL